MGICFYANCELNDITRRRANGYKKVEFSKDLNVPCMVSIESKDLDSDQPTLFIKPISKEEKEPEQYMILCKEIGFVGYNADFSNNISVMFCDNDYMLVTLHKGMFVLQDNESTLKVFTVGVKDIPQVELNNILWKNAKDLISFVRYIDKKADFIYDFDFAFKVKGGKHLNMDSFSVKHIDEDDRDISLGAFVVLNETVDKKAVEEKEQAEKVKAQTRRNLDRYFS